MRTTETKLPPELEREIFETTATLHRSTIPSLLRVAHRVLLWIEPFLYETIEIDESPKYLALLASASSKSPEFLARSVRRVTIYTIWMVFSSSSPLGRDACSDILRACTGITHLAMRPSSMYFYKADVLALLEPMRLQRLTCFVAHLCPEPDSPAPEFLRTITHLTLFDADLDPDGIDVLPLIASLPVLTHLGAHSVRDRDGAQKVQALLECCPRLRIFVILHYEVPKPNVPAPASTTIRDPRLVHCEFEDWAEGVSAIPNYWTMAEEFVENRRRGVISSERFWAHRRG
ncbi:hypothetical protein C8F01DRAFT_1153688 [Mycena amicta]|nr:hypothetical protein C8F01DRAFT_1153688 [Mycena amicta]